MSDLCLPGPENLGLQSYVSITTAASSLHFHADCISRICYRCNSHFCYLCSAWLDPANPYQHYNELPGGKRTSCYMRLWELEEGDENGQNLFAGGRGAAMEDGAHVPHAPQAPPPRPAGQPGEDARPAARERPAALNGEVAITHEGPLVLRLGAIAPPPQAEPEAPPQPAAPRREPLRGRGRGRRAAGRAGQQQRDGQRQLQEVGQHDEMADDDAAWVRHFVQLALLDNEDLLLDEA